MKKSEAIETISDGTQGKDPRKMTVEELNQLGHYKRSTTKLIKAMCNQCVGADQNGVRSIEVARCQCIGCPLWAYRMGKNPFSTRGEMSEEQKEIVKQRFAEARKKEAN